MAIEVTSVPDRRWSSSLENLARILPKHASRKKFRLLFRSTAAFSVLVLIIGALSTLRSYNHHSKIIDARLASGYLTSRTGLYAAPRTIRAGQGVSKAEMISALRRAGYVQTDGSEVWSGSFTEGDDILKIVPSSRIGITSVEVAFIDNTVKALRADGILVDSFKLEPEVLTNDPETKSGRRKALAYSDLPTNLVYAILAIEDRRFFQHSGLDLFAIFRALFRNASDERIGQGGSTITQQLVKNTYLTPERTFKRKYAEAMLAFALERRLTKEDIFALYCNEIYLGQRAAITVRGVEQAALVYFGKELKDLSLGEAATIAGMIQGPSRYSPERHPETSLARRNVVLAAMVRDGWISTSEASNAAKEPLAVVNLSTLGESLAPYFVDYVNRVADSQLGLSPHKRQIHTTIDLDLQLLAETALNRQLSRLDKNYKNGDAKPEAALVALDPRTGNVLAMIGGRNYEDSQLNRATDALRQPGSTFKPFVYSAALETGLSPLRPFNDAPREFTYDRNKVYRPANYGGGYSMRDVPMRTGLIKSLNVVTVDVAMQTGLARIANLAARAGLPKPERYPSLALGTTEVTPLQLAAAYAIFANGGRRVEPKVIAETADQRTTTQVIKQTTAYMITDMLSAVIEEGTAHSARDLLKEIAIAGKTGTSRDGWFVGYTPNLVCVVWIGFDDNRQLGLTGSEAALPAWVEFIKGAIALRPELGGSRFEWPEGIKFVEIDTVNGLLSTLTCPSRQLIAITENYAPNFECYSHGNLPDSGEHFEVLERPNQTVQKRSPVQTTRMITEGAKATRVDIDQNGRRTLVNDMR